MKQIIYSSWIPENYGENIHTEMRPVWRGQEEAVKALGYELLPSKQFAWSCQGTLVGVPEGFPTSIALDRVLVPSPLPEDLVEGPGRSICAAGKKR